MKLPRLKQLLVAAQADDHNAQNELAEYLLSKALGMASKRFNDNGGLMNDRSDLALSAANSLYFRLKDNKVQLMGNPQLLAMLKQIVIQKKIKYWKYENAQKRDVTRKEPRERPADITEQKHRQPVLETLDSTDEELSDSVNDFICHIDQDFQALFVWLFSRLSEIGQKVLMLMCKDSGTVKEHANKLGCSKSTVERERARIEELIQQTSQNSDGELSP